MKSLASVIKRGFETPVGGSAADVNDISVCCWESCILIFVIFARKILNGKINLYIYAMKLMTITYEGVYFNIENWYQGLSNDY